MLLAREVTPDISACLFHLNIRVEGKSLGWLTVTPGSKQLNSISPTIGGSALLKFDGESLHVLSSTPDRLYRLVLTVWGSDRHY
jgi:hypothetical protein